jgi:hypothetical protein
MRKMLLLAAASVLAAHTAVTAEEPRVTLTVTPAIAFAPASLTIRTFVEPDAANRLLRVVVDSPGFATASEVPLNGRSAQRLNILEVKGVPSGEYRVRAEVFGTSGQLAETVQIVRIQSTIA